MNEASKTAQPMKEIYKVVSIADIHMGVLDPKYMYEQLHKQFIERIYNLDFDIMAVCGDVFDSRYMSNNPIISYAILLVDEMVNLCRSKGATLIIIDGTFSHDNGQLSLFYHYMQDPTVDVRIVENIQFEEVKGIRVLCIPERYGLDKSVYENVLYDQGRYDLCLIHGTFKGSVFGSDVATLQSSKAPVFAMKYFKNCAGPILMGHVHVAGNYEEYAYYHGSALRFKFGEEETKGFLVTLLNTTTRMHYTELIPIDSYIYNTISIDNIINEDPKKIIEYIKQKKEEDHIDYIRVQFHNAGDNINIVRNYFKNTSNVKLQELDKKDKQMEQIDQTILEQNSQYSYLLDNDLSDYDKFVKYINQNEGYDFITVDDLINILEEA